MRCFLLNHRQFAIPIPVCRDELCSVLSGSGGNEINIGLGRKLNLMELYTLLPICGEKYIDIYNILLLYNIIFYPTDLQSFMNPWRMVRSLRRLGRDESGCSLQAMVSPMANPTT